MRVIDVTATPYPIRIWNGSEFDGGYSLSVAYQDELVCGRDLPALCADFLDLKVNGTLSESVRCDSRNNISASNTS